MGSGTDCPEACSARLMTSSGRGLGFRTFCGRSKQRAAAFGDIWSLTRDLFIVKRGRNRGGAVHCKSN